VPRVSQERTHPEFGNGYRSDGHVVIIFDHLIQDGAGPLRIDEERGVEEQTGH
jgi:hypothetical protein